MKKRISAAEFLARLNSDPEWVAMKRKKEEELQQRASQIRREEEPLLLELHTAGFCIDSVWDFVNTADPYPAALPILLKHFQMPYPAIVREGIARALAVPDGRFAWKMLVGWFEKEESKRVKDGLAIAVAVTAFEEGFDEVVRLLRSPLGPSRVFLLQVLEKSKNPRAKDLLRELESDPELAKEIAIINKRLHSRKNGQRS